MKALIFDTDILSTFGKIRRLDLLRKLLPEVPFYIPPSVYDELLKAKDLGYDFVDNIFESKIIEVIPLNDEEMRLLKELKRERVSLGKGELEGLSVCKHEGYILVTNDTSAKKVCDFYGIDFIDLSIILKSLITEKILTNSQVRILIEEIESKDRVVIKDKQDILN
ncbi:Uncharacterised protein [uncultured archaeon]|nr:Uncharacterised protein [uncultured archaeon]